MRRPSNLLLLSLGNPSEYNGTRHSVGHYVLNKVASRLHAESARIGRFDVKFVKADNDLTNIWMFNVPGYMNLSGKSVSSFYKQYLNTINNNLTENPVIILHDELDVELGKIKIRKQGSSHRGHNGLRNYQLVIGKQYTGVQIGIGRNYDDNDVAKYVLSKFKHQENEVLDDIVVDKVIDFLKECSNGKYVYDKL